jgi:segregation and condensation protein B
MRSRKERKKMTGDSRRGVVEALLFASSKPLSVDNLSEAAGIDIAGVREILAALQEEYSSESRGFSLEEVAEGFQLRSDPRYADQIGKLFAARSRRRMTRSSLESLSIIAYRQPVTKAEIEHIRGVDSGAVLKTLLSLSMIRILGRKEAPGRPILYGTTRDFLEYFGLRDIESLPTLEEVTEFLDGDTLGEQTFDVVRRGLGELEEEAPEAEGEELPDFETKILSDEGEGPSEEEKGDDEEESDDSTST